jgi:hypothetical protein
MLLPHDVDITFHRVSTMKRPDFGDILKISTLFSIVKGLLLTTEVQISA